MQKIMQIKKKLFNFENYIKNFCIFANYFNYFNYDGKDQNFVYFTGSFALFS